MSLFVVILLFHSCASAAERSYEAEFKYAAMSSKVDAQLLRAICYVESSFKVRAVHYKDGGDNRPSYGICQLKESTARDMGFEGRIKDLRKPEINIKYAAEYLAFQLERYDNDIGKALTAYNRGSFKRGVDRRNQYVAAVLLAYYEKK
jgi:soluble lytic murein transglycosylase-like protein